MKGNGIHRSINAPLLGALIVALTGSACDLGDGEDEGEPKGATAEKTPFASALREVEPLVTDAAAVDLYNEPNQRTPSSQPSPKPAACPEHMLNVDGSYCPEVMHRCIKGGRNHLGEDTAEPEPFYCDKYLIGYAKCFGKEIDKRFCIDEYEYPNQQGVLPVVMVSWYEARQLCEVQGKRLCGDDEWTLACEGPERLPYPYGWERDSTACNIDHPWLKPNDGLLASKSASLVDIQSEVERLSKRVPSGSMPDCKSPFNVMDLGGNVDEWATNVTLHGRPYQSVFKGGHWVRGARNRCRPVTVSHDETTAYYAEGFRCCAEQATIPIH